MKLQKLSSACPPDTTYVPITDKIKEAFLTKLNEKRNLVAEGKLDGVFLDKTAIRMPTLVSNFKWVQFRHKTNAIIFFFFQFDCIRHFFFG